MIKNINELNIGIASPEEADAWMKSYKDGEPIPEHIQRYCTQLLKAQNDAMSELARKFRTGEK